ncbi:MAG: hypothetical protein ACYC1F_12335 [Gallionellaceae bacterium]
MNNDEIMQRYHPERYRKGRPVIRQLEKQMPNMSFELVTREVFEHVHEVLSLQYNEDISLVSRDDRPESLHVLMSDSSMAMHYLAFVGAGRNIFHFGDGLTQAFRRTDVTDFVLGEIVLPYPTVYLSFGAQADLEPFGDDAKIDGAYVTDNSGHCIQILLTTRGQPSDKPWFNRWEKYYYLSLRKTDLSMTVVEACEAALKEEIEQSLAGVAKHEVKAAEMGVKSRAHQTAIERVAEYQSAFPVFMESLKLVINGLAYLAHYRDDIEKRWVDGTPPAMIEKIERATTYKEKQRVVSKLLSMGYTIVNLCGMEFEKTREAHGVGSEMSAHWRRGHWRIQPHGPGRTLRKRVWIMPVLVRSDLELKAGHIYLAEN